MREDLVLLTDGTSFHIVRNPFLHSRPIIMFLSFSQCLVSSGVSCSGVVVYEAHDPSFDFIEGRYEGFSFWVSCCDLEFSWCEDCDVLVVFLSSICSRRS